jgi:pimeloyl-ACP methyl ester carboxylesterase
MTFADKTIATRSASIRVTQSIGTGMPLLLLHGSGSNRTIFDKQMQSALADRFRMIALDLPGHGDSSNADDIPATQSYTLPGLASTVGEVIDQLGLSRVAVLGWSLGGHIALELMSFHQSVAGVMVMGAPPIGRGPLALLRAFRATLDTSLASKARFSDAEVTRFATLCFGDRVEPAQIASIRRTDGQLRKIMFSSMLGGRCADERHLVETSPIPVAIVNGSEDPLVRLRYIAGLRYRALWDGMCHVIPNAGHAAFREEPKTFNPMLMRFASDIEAQRVVAEHEQMPTAMPAAEMRKRA